MPDIQKDSPMERAVGASGKGSVKLRSSCDACSTAKVKRHGKQSWARRVAEQHQRYLESTTYSPTSQPSATENSFLQYYPQSVAPGTFAIPSVISPITPTGSMGNLALGNNAVVSPSTDQCSNFGDNFTFPNLWPSVNTSVAPVFSPSPASTSTATISEASTSPQLGQAFQPQVHDCEAKALATLHSLYHSTPVSPQPGKPIQNTPSLDRILHENRNALSTVRQLMQCPCAHQPHNALLYMAIVSKTLFWYRLAVNLSFRTATQVSEIRSPSSPQAHSVSYLAPNPHMSGITDGVASDQATDPPKSNTIQFGTFDLEEEEEAILVRNIVVTEVKKAGRLVGSMRGGGTRMNIAEGHERARIDEPWYIAGGEKLEKEVQDTLRAVMEKHDARVMT
ncbi:hypothetical protein BU23DRAFT_600747 [Bimuria novae-zelandiae CBS 107.79]|uniref:Aflatoxin regulatory protein domain-containing protein n=1 Tax=Bimuria novae-zelandiae CBS 107.79 TaxID=1447943 RepID=A0A6A5V2Z2_9PLEO|nr:hypothetical protein BU23DRAFT_600747 [Bimuria novae-zelandiae CBS 107.79]